MIAPAVAARAMFVAVAGSINGEVNGLFATLKVPEPSSMALLGLAVAILGLGRVRWRRRA